MSGKGQIVIPKATRERLRLATGDRFEVIERPDGVLLRVARPAKDGRTFEEITAAIRARNPYRGPPVPVEDMNRTIDEAFARDGGVLWD